MNYLLAYDFGTGGIKASLYNEQGECLADGFDSYQTFYPAAGFHEQEPEAWWQATISSTHKLFASVSDDVRQHIVGIGISGHSLGVVPLDKNGRLLRERTIRGHAGRCNSGRLQPEDHPQGEEQQRPHLQQHLLLLGQSAGRSPGCGRAGLVQDGPEIGPGGRSRPGHRAIAVRSDNLSVSG